jgi:hypothetical protein
MPAAKRSTERRTRAPSPVGDPAPLLLPARLIAVCLLATRYPLLATLAADSTSAAPRLRVKQFGLFAGCWVHFIPSLTLNPGQENIANPQASLRLCVSGSVTSVAKFRVRWSDLLATRCSLLATSAGQFGPSEKTWMVCWFPVRQSAQVGNALPSPRLRCVPPFSLPFGFALK